MLTEECTNRHIERNHKDVDFNSPDMRWFHEIKDMCPEVSAYVVTQSAQTVLPGQEQDPSPPSATSSSPVEPHGGLNSMESDIDRFEPSREEELVMLFDIDEYLKEFMILEQ